MIQNFTQKTEYQIVVQIAQNFLTKLLGLLGTTSLSEQEGLLIRGAKQIHTLGMSYPIDVVYLDKDGYVLETETSLKPNRIGKSVHRTHSVLELNAKSIDELHIHKGDHLQIKSEFEHRITFKALSRILHWPINLFIALLWSQFVAHAVQNLSTHQNLLSLGILFHNTLLLLLFLTRRASSDTTRKPLNWIIPIITVALTMFLRPSAGSEMWQSAVSGGIQCIGLGAIIISLLSLGRSFGVIPANRNVKINGIYQWVRHPLYMSETIFYIGFLFGNPSLTNVTLLLFILGGQIWRSVIEEELLINDPHYQKYVQKVRFRFIPGIL